MSEPTKRINRRNKIQRLCQRLLEGLAAASTDAPQNGFQLGESLFNKLMEAISVILAP